MSLNQPINYRAQILYAAWSANACIYTYIYIVTHKSKKDVVIGWHWHKRTAGYTYGVHIYNEYSYSCWVGTVCIQAETAPTGVEIRLHRAVIRSLKTGKMSPPATRLQLVSSENVLLGSGASEEITPSKRSIQQMINWSTSSTTKITCSMISITQSCSKIEACRWKRQCAFAYIGIKPVASSPSFGLIIVHNVN